MSLAFIPPGSPLSEPLLPVKTAARLHLGTLGDGGYYREASADFEAGCLRCPDTPCASYSLEERDGDSTVPPAVCPTDALRPAQASMEVSDACIGCGLCVLRCQFGAIRLVDARAEVAVAVDGYEVVERDAARVGRERIVASRESPSGDARGFVATIQDNLVSSRQTVFYRFVASLLTALGIPARASNTGDTSLRMDAVCPHPVHSVPVEIKSPTEVATADLKAVRQALENHVIMRARCTDPTMAQTATFAIGHEPVPVRSDATELAHDIERTYRVRIRLFSTVWLLGQLTDHVLNGRAIDTVGLRLGRVKE
jgi:ferredoxin